VETVLRIIQDKPFETLDKSRLNLPRLTALDSFVAQRPPPCPHIRVHMFCAFVRDTQEAEDGSNTNMGGGEDFGTNIRGKGDKELETNRNTGNKVRKG
jgi:hypothetical protein